MEIKKSLSADLEGKKGTGLLMGFVLALSAMFVAFEWTQHDKKVIETEPVFTAAIEEDMIPITQQPEVVAPPPGTGTTAVATGPVGPVVEEVDENQIYDIVEENPRFPGGEEACMKWLSDNIKYPPICVEQGIQGRVYAQFVVNKDGSIVDIKIVRSPDPYLSKEAERVLKMMPKWSPGKQRGKPVRVKFSLPVMFRLQ